MDLRRGTEAERASGVRRPGEAYLNRWDDLLGSTTFSSATDISRFLFKEMASSVMIWLVSDNWADSPHLGVFIPTLQRNHTRHYQNKRADSHQHGSQILKWVAVPFPRSPTCILFS